MKALSQLFKLSNYVYLLTLTNYFVTLKIILNLSVSGFNLYCLIFSPLNEHFKVISSFS